MFLPALERAAAKELVFLGGHPGWQARSLPEVAQEGTHGPPISFRTLVATMKLTPTLWRTGVVCARGMDQPVGQ